MGFSNPFIPNMPFIPNFAPAPAMYGQNQSRPQIDPQQFRQFAITLNDNALNNFAQMARQQGISEADIQAGIRFIKSL